MSLSAKLSSFIGDRHFKDLIAASTTAFLFKVGGILSGYIFILLVSRNYGANTMGILALSITVLNAASVVGRLGFDTALIRFVAEYSSQNRRDLIRETYLKSLRIVIPAGLLTSVALFLQSPVLASGVMHKPYLGPYFQVISLAILPMIVLFINTQSLRAVKKITEYSFFEHVAPTLFASIVLGIALLTTKPQMLPVFAYGMGLFLSAGASFWVWWNRMNMRSEIAGGPPGVSTQNMFTASLPMLFSSIMFFVLGWTDTILLGIFRTDAEVGIYTIALKISAVTSITLVAINSIAAPKFAEMFCHGDMTALGNVVRYSSKMIFWTSVPLLLALICIPSYLLHFFGKEFTAGASALVILSLGQFVNSISGSVGILLNMTGKEKIFRNIMFVATCINIVLNLILIPRFGITGAACASTVSMLFWNICSVFYIRAVMHINTLYVPILSERMSAKYERAAGTH